MSAKVYEPQPDSLPGRFIAWLRANPDDELSAADIRLKFDAPAANPAADLVSALAHGLVERSKDGSGRFVYMAGPRLAASEQMAERARASMLGPLGADHASATTRRRQVLEPLDPAAFQVRNGVPLPPARGILRGATRYDALFDRLAVAGSSIEGLPLEHRKAVASAGKKYAARTGRKLALRIAGDGESFGIWRTA